MSDLDDDDHALIARLRALSPQGTEPAWDRFERDLAGALDAAPPRPWWRRWWTPAVGLGLAVGVAAAALWLHRAPAAPRSEVIATAPPDAREPEPPAPTPPARAGDAVLALGSEGDVSDAELDDAEVVAEVLAALAPEDGEDGEDDGAAFLGDVPDEPAEGLVPDLELDWVDDLDDAEVDTVTAWLDDEAG